MEYKVVFHCYIPRYFPDLENGLLEMTTELNIFNEKVNKYLNNGYLLNGGINTKIEIDSGYCMFFQSVYKIK